MATQPFEDLGQIDQKATPSTGMALVIAAQIKYAAYCKRMSEQADCDAVAAAKRRCRKTFIHIADEIYNRIPEDQR
jgi:hypothetical protein